MSSLGSTSYRNVTAYGSLADATPHQVVQVMFEVILARIAEARGHMERGEVQAKGEKIGKALGIVEALLMGLDKDRGGDLATNLERIYDYVSRTLLRANLENRVELLQEVMSLLREVKAGWDAIAAQSRA
ncbi:MAG TPA: flagellar export chaperone FliS [Gammaproteobacteria bacterium]|nr:flagellar export chaperone FliS [Gammaproteobacteria bacterium]